METIFDPLLEVVSVSQLESLVAKRHKEFSGWDSKCTINNGTLTLVHDQGQELVYNLKTNHEVYGRVINCGLTQVDLDALKGYLDLLMT